MMAPIGDVVAIRGNNAAQHRHEREADAHDDRQPAANTPQREQLDQSADAGDEHGPLDERARLNVTSSRPPPPRS